MKRFIKQNIFIVIIGIFSLMSSVFLISDYHITNNNKSIAKISAKSIEEEVKHEKEEFESSDFNIFKNISEAIDEIFSLGF